MSYDISQGDLDPAMPVRIADESGAVDLAIADSVQLVWRQPDGTVTTVDLSPVSASAGQYERIWEDGDTNQVGAHRGQVVVVISGRQQTYPSDGSSMVWWVNPRLDA